MRDPGLEEAVRAVGGVSELARQIGISQPSVSNWTRIPAERVLIVEATTGVDRKVLRPDLYGPPEQNQQMPDDVALARAQEYALLATLLVRAPDAKLLESLAGLRGDATPLGVAHAALAQAASETTVERVEREYLQPVHRTRPRRIVALRVLLSHRFPARTSAGAAACRSRPARNRTNRWQLRARRSRRDPVRDHGGHCERPVCRRHRAPTSRFSRSICRPGSGGSLPIWNGPRPPISIAE